MNFAPDGATAIRPRDAQTIYRQSRSPAWRDQASTRPYPAACYIPGSLPHAFCLAFASCSSDGVMSMKQALSWPAASFAEGIMSCAAWRKQYICAMPLEAFQGDGIGFTSGPCPPSRNRAHRRPRSISRRSMPASIYDDTASADHFISRPPPAFFTPAHRRRPSVPSRRLLPRGLLMTFVDDSHEIGCSRRHAVTGSLHARRPSQAESSPVSASFYAIA